MGRKYRLRRWLHRHHFHWFCRVVVDEKQVVDHTDMGPEYLTGIDPATGKEVTIDVTLFGGRPVYRTERWVDHG